jgi:hypothetical protein
MPELQQVLDRQACARQIVHLHQGIRVRPAPHGLSSDGSRTPIVRVERIASARADGFGRYPSSRTASSTARRVAGAN